ncbi:DUF4432 family protein [Oryzibacter oryziterrae]|uniref:DUF4432 family protein n=1 Tax=Oryzibacter oryziterrae TaxID=2766474 RepID=UPI001F238476|nr:DUF4432 family protein [Oryzibacter oryziterrae]
MSLDYVDGAATAVVDLTSVAFGEVERTIFRSGRLAASVFRYPTGVDAVRIGDGDNEMVILPFQGQHIWRARLGGRDVTMKSMFDMPRPTLKFFETYGGFYQHAGATAIGAPEPGERREQHGELPNAPYGEAAVYVGEDADGRFIAVTGRYNHTVAFATNYAAVPVAKVYEGSGRIFVGMTVTNLKASPMEVHYLGHLNWRAADHAELFGTTIDSGEAFRVRQEIPPHIKPGPGYVEWIDRLAKDPTPASVLSPDKLFAPEVVFTFDSLTDDAGQAHFLAVHGDGSGDYVSFAPLGGSVRWICRTPDQDALGLAFPVHSVTTPGKVNGVPVEHKPLGPGETFKVGIRAGVLPPSEVAKAKAHIAGVKARHG